MTSKDYDMITSEIKQLETLLNKIPQERAIERLGLESRLRKARQSIENFNAEDIPHQATITFRGNPVVGTHGIFADFAANAAGAFAASISAIAASLSDNLKYMGPIPNRQENQLLITGTAIGSFGFVFEVPKTNTDTLFPGSSDAEMALEKLQTLFASSLEGDDDDLTELVEEIHPRAVAKVIEFLNILKTNHAWCALAFKEKKFRFSSFKDIEKSLSRLDLDNINEAEEKHKGRFQGVLPTSRTFEFKEGDTLIKGKIGANIKDPNILNTEYLGKNITVIFQTIQVGEGKPRYILKDITDIEYIKDN